MLYYFYGYIVFNAMKTNLLFVLLGLTLITNQACSPGDDDTLDLPENSDLPEVVDHQDNTLLRKYITYITSQNTASNDDSVLSQTFYYDKNKNLAYIKTWKR